MISACVFQIIKMANDKVPPSATKKSNYREILLLRFVEEFEITGLYVYIDTIRTREKVSL